MQPRIEQMQVIRRTKRSRREGKGREGEIQKCCNLTVVIPLGICLPGTVEKGNGRRVSTRPDSKTAKQVDKLSDPDTPTVLVLPPWLLVMPMSIRQKDGAFLHLEHVSSV